MAGAAARGVAVEHLGQVAADLDRGREALRVDLLDGGRVDEVDAGLGGQPQVALLVARIAVEVLAGTELGRVDEEAHHDHVALGAGGAQQREVALVQIAHRRHQPDRPPLPAQLGSSAARSSALARTTRRAIGHGGVSGAEVQSSSGPCPSGSRPWEPNYRDNVTKLCDLVTELDLLDHPRRHARGDRPRRQVVGDDRVGADDAALADRDAAGHRAVDPEPAVGADLDRALGGEALLGDRQRRGRRSGGRRRRRSSRWRTSCGRRS